MVWQVLLPIGLQVAGSVLGAYSNRESGRQQQRSYEASAAAEAKSTAFNIENFTKQMSAQVAKGRALRAGSGVEINTGSPLMVDDATISEIIRQTTQMQEEGEARVRALREGGQIARNQGRVGAVSSLLEGAANFISSDLFKLE